MKLNKLEFLAATHVEVAADPLCFAADAAFAALERPGLSIEHTGQRAIKAMPASSTKFERGIAFGLALGLAFAGSTMPADAKEMRYDGQSRPHHIECLDPRTGAVVRQYDNDTSGPYYLSRNGAGVTFLDKRDGRMKRVPLSNCEESWAPGDDY